MRKTPKRSSAAILIPVLDRPARVAPLLESILEAGNRDADITPVFICSPGDKAEIAAVEAAGITPFVVGWNPGKGDYARKLNYAFTRVETEWAFLAADDLRFCASWLDKCLERHRRTGACVIGTNDLGNSRVVSGRHSTHTLVHRDYAECGTVDDDRVILHEGYWHNFVDDEFVQTAMWRRTYEHCSAATIEHLHPDWGKGQMDATYRRGKEHFNDDRHHYNSRKHLWGKP